MLKQRVITASVLALLFGWGTFGLSPMHFSLLVGVVLSQGAWEWTGLMQLSHIGLRLVYCVCFLALLAVLWQLLHGYPELIAAILICSTLWWVVGLLFVLNYPKRMEFWVSPLIKGLIGLIILLPVWAALICIQASGRFGPGYVLLLVFIIWAADTGAYFGGRLWGKTKLAPRVSPGKTWEGVAGGMATVAIITLIGIFLLGLKDKSLGFYVIFLMLSLVTAVFSIIGDLVESMVKRQVGVKDSGKILPGHGGALDRIDSATAAAPVFALGLWAWLDLSLDLSATVGAN